MKLILIVIFWILSLPENNKERVVFKAGENGYANFRIPAIVKSGNGDLIAFAEGRVAGTSDFGNIDIVYKISTDSGFTWGPLKVAVNYSGLQAGNPAPVLDLLDERYANGRLFLFYNTGNNPERDVREGKGLREVWYITSTDNAKSWSAPVNITSQTHFPYQPDVSQDYRSSRDWRTYANTPGHVFQFISGPYEGRIYVAANHSQGSPRNDNTDWNAHAYYTDDHGQTFQLSKNVPYKGSNESSAAQIGESEVYMSSRNQRMFPRNRIVSISRDGGHSWEHSAPDPALPDPVNQGSVLSWKMNGEFILAHINAADTANRDNLTLRVSKDGGKTWFYTEVLAKAEKTYSGAYAAYSDIVQIKAHTLGVLFERNSYSEIVFLKVDIP